MEVTILLLKLVKINVGEIATHLESLYSLIDVTILLDIRSVNYTFLLSVLLGNSCKDTEKGSLDNLRSLLKLAESNQALRHTVNTLYIL